MTLPVVRYVALGTAFVAVPWVSIAILSLAQAVWLPWFEGGGWLPAAGFVVVMATLCGWSVLGTQAASVAGGYALGFSVGAPMVLLGTVLAAIVGYAVFARFGRWWWATLHDQPRVRALSEALSGADARSTWIVVALMRLAPVLPFGATNLVMAVHRVRRGPFVLGTLIGFAPLALLMTQVGATLAELRLGERPPVSLWIYSSFLLVAVGGLSLYAVRVLSRFQRDSGAS